MDWCISSSGACWFYSYQQKLRNNKHNKKWAVLYIKDSFYSCQPNNKKQQSARTVLCCCDMLLGKSRKGSQIQRVSRKKEVVWTALIDRVVNTVYYHYFVCVRDSVVVASVVILSYYITLCCQQQKLRHDVVIAMSVSTRKSYVCL